MSDNTVKSKATLEIAEMEDGTVKYKIDGVNTTDTEGYDKAIATALMIFLNDKDMVAEYLKVAGDYMTAKSRTQGDK